MRDENRSKISQLLPLSEVDFLILLILVDGDCHGYGIVKQIGERTGGKARLTPGNLYAMLRRLQRQGLVDEIGRREVPQSGGRQRRYYRVTRLGRQAAAAEAARMKSLVEAAEARRLIGSTAQ